MPDSAPVLKTEIVVVGAGVLGLCTAVALTRRGHDVRVVDPGGSNASSVAAGMIAPALEAVLDGVSPQRAAMFRDARAEWDGFATATGVRIDAAPAIWAGGDEAQISQAVVELGFNPAEAARDGRLRLPTDVLVEPGPAMAAMRAALRHPVIEAWVRRIEQTPDGWRLLTETGAVTAATVVLATGAATAIDGVPVATGSLVQQVSPVRGQIGGVEDLVVEAVTRGRGVYVAPSGGGAVLGATMEPGVRDLEPDRQASEMLKTAAETLLGHRIEGRIDWRVGVRGATPDGLPMAGPSGDAGLFLALAPRRNGWLLGPLVARVVVEAIEAEPRNGGAMSSHAAALDPRRFAFEAKA